MRLVQWFNGRKNGGATTRVDESDVVIAHRDVLSIAWHSWACADGECKGGCSQLHPSIHSDCRGIGEMKLHLDSRACVSTVQAM